MNRDDFIDLLARLVADGELSEDQAADILRQFDDGILADSWQLPLPLREAIRKHNRENERLALLALLALLSSKGQPALRPFSLLTGRRLADSVQGEFESRVDDLARLLTDGKLTLSGWQQGMLDEVERHVIQQMYLGNGTERLTRAQLSQLDTIMAEQGAFLQRFADHAALTAGQGQPWSEDYIANRSRAYGGVGRGEYFRSNELAMLARGDIGTDAKCYYVSRDDRSTCDPCLTAERRGPYEIGSNHPVPGEVCLGRSNCRCHLEYR